jgi:hypothetical protein
MNSGLDDRNLSAGLLGAGQARSAIEAMLKDKFADASKQSSQSDTEIPFASDERTAVLQTPTKSPPKSRSLSDSTPKLSPSPKIREFSRHSKDDHNLETPSRTPIRRPDFSSGLALQMPTRDHTSLQNPLVFASRVPLSPQIDTRNTYGSPAKVLPRHSRGLDFARACTNLHHSTLAEQSSPDSSPTITQKGMMIPPRKMSVNAMMVDAPNTGEWPTHRSERGGVPSSLGSISMLASESSSSSDDDDDAMDPDDGEEPMITTPQAYKRMNPTASTPFAGSSNAATNWANVFSPSGGSSFMSYQRARLRHGRSRKSSSSASGHSSMASPVPTSPGGKNDNGSYFTRELTMRKPSSRRESISFATSDLHISSGNDSDTEAMRPIPTTPGVVRRPVTRRGNLLVSPRFEPHFLSGLAHKLQPKTRAFGRIRAELLEETMPADTEIKNEAEILRQVRENDPEVDRPLPTTSQSSPTLPAIPGLSEGLEGIPEDSAMNLDNGGMNSGKGLFGAFGRHPSIVNSTEFWTSFQKDTRTPPPPSFFPRGSVSAASDDVNMDSPTVSTPSNSVCPSQSNNGLDAPFTIDSSRSSTPQPQPQPPTAAEGLRKQNKRRRDDDFDIISFKRRAVSPGVSVQNSPILSQSPGGRGDLWGQPKVTREASLSTNGASNNERSSSAGSTVPNATPVLGPKRVGLQGMNDMQGLTEKMSLE